MKKYTNLTVILLLTTFWFLISFLTKAMFSGFHLTDDAKIFNINREILSNGFLHTLVDRTIDYTALRLKPLYIVHKVIATGMFGLNYTLWSIHITILAIITNFNLYLFAKRINFSILQALVFSFFTLLGVQSMIWMHLGYDEMLGMVFLSFALLFMARGAKDENKKINDILFVVFSILMSYTKETFILIMPALVFWYNWLYKESAGVKWIPAIKNNRVISIILTGLFAINIAAIQFLYKPDIGYAGVSGITVGQCFENLLRFFNGQDYTLFIFPLIYLLAAIWFFILISRESYIGIKQNLLKHMPVLVLAIMIIIPQVIVYTKTGFYPRYLLPVMLGYSFLLAYSLNLLSAKNIYSKKFVKGLLFLALLVYFVNYSAITTRISYNYAQHGASLYKMFDSMQKLQKDEIILVVGNPSQVNYEQIVNIRKYLIELKKIDAKQIYLLPLLYRGFDEYPDHQRKIIQKAIDIYNQRTIFGIRDTALIKYIIVFNKEKEHFQNLMQNNLFIKQKDYEVREFSGFDLYIKTLGKS